VPIRRVLHRGSPLFLDTNTYLSFYHFSSDDLEELLKLAVLLSQKKLALYLPQQIIDEFRRNRESKIADALRRFKDERLSEFPQMCKDYPEYETAREALKRYQEAKSRLIEKLRSHATEACLKADKVIEELFKQASVLPITDEILIAARRRADLGNPPGKAGSLGDALNWECLLANAPSEEELILISGDSDYRSPSNDDELSSYLRREWRDAKSAEIAYFTRPSAFFKARFPHIKLATELEKEILIRELQASSSFADTRRTLRRLAAHKDLTDQQLNDILEAAVSNTQIYWIVEDHDINHYLRKILLADTRGLDPENLRRFERFLGEELELGPETDEDDDILS
jgi:hypothetical protein